MCQWSKCTIWESVMIEINEIYVNAYFYENFDDVQLLGP